FWQLVFSTCSLLRHRTPVFLCWNCLGVIAVLFSPWCVPKTPVFVPSVQGRLGASEGGTEMRTLRERWPMRESPGIEELAAHCRQIAHPLRNPRDLDPLMDRIGNARYVLLGEASHGTS